MREVYLDNNATTPVDPEVEKTMLPYFREFFGNPSSLHKKGVEAMRGIEKARSKIADALHVKSLEIVFTSGATESINWAIKGAVFARQKSGNHIITQKTEHKAVLRTCQYLENKGFNITYLNVDSEGRVNKDELVNAITGKTILIAIIHVNNEIGTIHPINNLARVCKNKKHDILFFSDGVQALGKLQISLENIDLYAMSSHKIHGPKGVGALFIKEGLKIEKMIHGGNQENRHRAGTENVGGIVGFGRAVELMYEDFDSKKKHFNKLRNKLWENIEKIEYTRFNSPKDGVLTTINASFRGVPAEVLLHALEQEGIYVSTDSACSSASIKASHVLEAIKVPKDFIGGSLRFGLSLFLSEDDIEHASEVLDKKVKKLRSEING
jgi:cysteine desulfurase